MSIFAYVKSHHIVLFVLVIVALLVFHFRNKLAGLHDRYRANRRARYVHLNNTFEEDLESGLSSNTFDIESNISNNDSRKGLLEEAKQEIKKIMSQQGLSFDDARLKYVQTELNANNIGPDGMPLDPKTVTFK